MLFGPVFGLFNDVAGYAVARPAAAISHDVYAALAKMTEAYIQTRGLNGAASLLADQLDELV